LLGSEEEMVVLRIRSFAPAFNRLKLLHLNGAHTGPVPTRTRTKNERNRHKRTAAGTIAHSRLFCCP
jgi:hypothetical protein